MLTPELPELPDGGGIGTNTAVMSRELAARGHEVLVLRLGDRLHVESRHGVVVRTVRRRWVPDQRAELLLNLARLALAARRFRADVVHAAEWGALGWGVVRLTRLPLVTRLATPTYLVDEVNGASPAPQEALRRRLERDQARHSALVYAPSHAIAQRVGEDWQLPHRPLPVVRNSVNVQAIAAARARPVPVELPERFVVFLGRTEHRKGIEPLGAAIGEVLARHPDLHLVCVGKVVDDGGAASALATFRRSVAAVADRVHLFGEVPRDDALAIAARAEVGVVPSLWESFGYVCVELMALGLPVIASDAGGLAEIVGHDGAGILVPPGDANALAAALEAVATDPDARARLSARGRSRASEYEASVVVELVEEKLAGACGHVAFDRDVFQGSYPDWFQPEDEKNPFRRQYEQKRRLVLDQFAGTPRQLVLDVGGGYGRVARPLSDSHRVVLSDLSGDMLRKARAVGGGPALVQADALHLPAADETFDHVVAVDLVCHLPDLTAALVELTRVVRPGGSVVFDTTNGRPWWVLLHPSYVAWRPRRLLRTLRHRGVLPEWPHVRHHLPAEVRAAAAAAGLEVESVGAVGRAGIPKWHVWRIRRPPR